MSKALRTVALVVGAVALIATGIGAAVGAGIIGAAGAAGGAATFAGLTAATFATIGTIAGLAATALTFAASALAKPPSVTTAGDQTQFTASKDQGLPYAIGRTSVSGFVAHQQTWDSAGSKNNAYRTFFGVWSCAGPIQQIESFQADNAVVTFSSGAAQGPFAGYMWLNTQLGQSPEAAALTATSINPYPAGWSPSSKLSGYAAFAWTLKFDTAGKIYAGGQVPTPTAVLKGVRVYDPRQDSTFPGGSGPCRALDESTYVWAGLGAANPAGENPFLQALTWALGRFQNGKRIIGMGMALAAIDVPAYVHAANIADANNWKIGGVVYSTDGKWDVIKKMLMAGSGAPLQLGGILSCTVDTPRVSLATITTGELIGAASVTGTPASKDRFNGVIPTYRDETQKWQLVPAAQVQVADYVTADGRPRTRGMTWELVQDVHQVSQLATYAISNSREFGPIVMPLKLRWIGYKPGDALTIASPEAGMDSQLVVVQKRNLEPTTGAVTLTMRSETSAKHAFALGKTGTAPPTPSLQVVDRGALLLPGVSASWSAVADDDGNRPDDNATVGAPAGTTIAGRPAEDVIGDLTYNSSTALQALLITNGFQAIVDAQTYVQGQSVATFALNEHNDRIDGQNAINASLNLLGTKNADGTAWVLNASSVVVNADGSSLGTVLTQIGATTADHEQRISLLFSNVISSTGAESKAVLTVNQDGAITGFSATSDGVTGNFAIVADVFQLIDPNGGAPFTPFLYSDGVTKMGNVEVDKIKIGTGGTVGLPSIIGASAAVAATASYGDVLATTVTTTGPATIYANTASKLDFPNGTVPWAVQLLINGTQVFAVDGQAYSDSCSTAGALHLPAAGTYTISLQIKGTGFTIKARTLFAVAYYGG
jgi:hypothetical protein